MMRATILVVEDEVIIALDLEARLQSLGHAVAAVAITGQEAVEFSRGNLPDLIFMDIGLGGEMDGIEAAAKIREHSNVPIIFLTAFTDTNTRLRAALQSPAAILAKPFRDEELAKAISAALPAGK
jgi:CheY-like chemotaxis protein